MSGPPSSGSGSATPGSSISATSATAPGKLILFGEYAVLRGATAIVMAIDRRARANISNSTAPLSSFLAEAEALLSDSERSDSAVRVDTSDFASDGRKLGFGSSAAATVAYLGARTGGSISKERIHQLAHHAHGAVGARAGARGSGIDVAASVWGGVLAARQADSPASVPAQVRPINLPTQVSWLGVDCGQPANTRTLVSAIEKFAATQPKLFELALGEIESASSSAQAACEQNDPDALLAAVNQGSLAIEHLGDSSQAPLIIPIMKQIRQLADTCGGAAKPTGAAGGDTVWAGFKTEPDRQRFRDQLSQVGIKPIELSVDPLGLSYPNELL